MRLPFVQPNPYYRSMLAAESILLTRRNSASGDVNATWALMGRLLIALAVIIVFILLASHVRGKYLQRRREKKPQGPLSHLSSGSLRRTTRPHLAGPSHSNSSSGTMKRSTQTPSACGDRELPHPNEFELTESTIAKPSASHARQWSLPGRRQNHVSLDEEADVGDMRMPYLIERTRDPSWNPDKLHAWRPLDRESYGKK